ncbi:MAG: hypothetical protein IJL38_00900 [Bacteroidales bacterium]|nr:hypothetical protein [Bacteroidales bacterium]
MKNHYLSKTIATIFLVALCISCKDPYPYGYHEYVEVVNNSDSPIYIVGVAAEYNPEKIRQVNPSDTYRVSVANESQFGFGLSTNCLENYIEYYESRGEHPRNFVLYLCDTTEYTKDTLFELDPYYNRYEVLKVVDLISVGLEKLIQSNFIINYP